jgi:hypothetical protein
MMAMSLPTLVGGRYSSIIYVPSSTGATDEVENFAGLYWGTGLSFVAQSVHEALQDIERREPAHSAAIERQQTESLAVKRVWLAAARG